MSKTRFLSSAGAFALACLTLIAAQGQRDGAAVAAAGAQGAAAQSGAPALGQGTLIGGAWGAAPVPVAPDAWGSMSKTYVSSTYKRPFWNKAKELLFSGKQVTSFTISALDPALYCEVRKHYGFVWFEMQHSTMSWDDVAKMIAACPGPDGAAPFIRMPDQNESSIQKATDLGAIGLIFPTIRDGHQALEAARYSRFPPFGRRSSGAGQAGSVWSKSVCCGMVRFGPDGKIHTMLSDVPNGVWHAAHEPQPLFDIRPTIGVVVPGAGSNTPTDVW